MDIATLSQAIGSIGFPIIMCILMYERLNKQSVEHKEEMTKITESLNNNTLALQKLSDKLDKG
jgi:hypothetical protein